MTDLLLDKLVADMRDVANRFVIMREEFVAGGEPTKRQLGVLWDA